MPKGDAKFDPRRLIRTHFAAFVDARTGARRTRDFVSQVGIPLLAVGACSYFEVRLPAGACVGLLTVAGLFSAFMFGLLIQISDSAMAWEQTLPAKSPATSEHAQELLELAAHAGYGSLVSIATSAIFVAASVTHNWALVVLAAIGIGLAIHLVFTMLMVMKRVFALTEGRLVRIRTGASTPEYLEQKRAS
jgi:hypothetical protein